MAILPFNPTRKRVAKMWVGRVGIRSVSAHQGSGAMCTQLRRLKHEAASGSLNKFNYPDAVKALSERTMVSSLFSRHEAQALNPSLDTAIGNLTGAGHGVAFDVDATLLHDTSNAGVQEMYKEADRLEIDMNHLDVAFLRSGTELEPDDKALMAEFMKSAKQSGVEKMTVTHSLARFNQTRYVAPHENTWSEVADQTGWQHEETREVASRNHVESVPRDGKVAVLQVRTVGESVFTPKTDTPT